MMYSCAPRSASSSSVVKKKAKSLRVDIHCHYANPEVAARVAGRNPGQHEPSVKYANALTREVERFGAGHVLLGTDYPYDMGVEDPVRFISSLSKKQRTLVEGANAARLLKIDYNSRPRRKV